MASSAAGDPSPPPTGGWLSDLVSGAGRFLAAVLGPESSASSASSSSSPESSQSPGTADHGNEAHFVSGSYQLNTRGKEIILKDSGEGSLAIVSEMDPKDAAMQLLMQETYTRSECDALIKIIQERVVDSDPGVDEPAVVLPIAWQDSTQEHPVAYSSFSPKTSPATSGIPAYSPVFDNIDEKRWLKENSTNVEGHCSLKSLKHDMSHPIGKRSYSNTGETFEESRRVRRKLNRSNISEKPVDVLRNRAASFDSPSTNDTSALRGFPKEFTNIPLLGTENLTFSDMASKAETSSDTAMFHDKPCAIPVQQLVSTSCQADWDKRDSTMSYPFSNLDPMETFPVKVEPLDELAPLEPDMTYLAQKNDTRTMCDDSCSVSKLMFQEDVEAAPSSSMGLQVENSSRNCTKALNVQRSVPTKTRSPANSNRRPNNRNAVKLWNGLPQQSNPAPVGQEPDAGQIHAKRSVGRPRKARRSRKAQRRVKNTRRLQL